MQDLVSQAFQLRDVLQQSASFQDICIKVWFVWLRKNPYNPDIQRILSPFTDIKNAHELMFYFWAEPMDKSIPQYVEEITHSAGDRKSYVEHVEQEPFIRTTVHFT